MKHNPFEIVFGIVLTVLVEKITELENEKEGK